MEPRAAERRAALSYAPTRVRAGLEALLSLDGTLGAIVRTTREPLVGQMRLTWWHEALTALDTAPAPAEPVLRALAGTVVATGAIAGARLAHSVEGWEVLLETLDASAVDRAADRGAILFEAMAALLGGATPAVVEAGRGWAFADLARHLTSPTLAAHARGQAQEVLDRAFVARWPRALRSLGALALLARDDLAARPGRPAGGRRIGRILWHRLTGR